MSENNSSSKIFQSIENMFSDFPWLFLDMLLLIFILSSMLGYKDFDDYMRLFFRGILIVFISNAWCTSLHFLVFFRKGGITKNMPWYLSLFFIFLKFVIILIFIYWAYLKNLI